MRSVWRPSTFRPLPMNGNGRQNRDLGQQEASTNSGNGFLGIDAKAAIFLVIGAGIGMVLSQVLFTGARR